MVWGIKLRLPGLYSQYLYPLSQRNSFNALLFLEKKNLMELYNSKDEEKNKLYMYLLNSVCMLNGKFGFKLSFMEGSIKKHLWFIKEEKLVSNCSM